jgi:hypothetical protein
MSTRSCITRPAKGGFKGVYHHWDGYPAGVGSRIYELYNTIFEKNVEKMLKFLIDDHPAGWSSIWGDPFKPIGFVENDWNSRGSMDINEYQMKKPMMCYCHGSRSEEAWPMTHKNASESGCEYAYVISSDGHMLILSDYFPEDHPVFVGEKAIGAFGMGPKGSEIKWCVIGEVDLNGSEPDWESFKEPLKVYDEKST